MVHRTGKAHANALEVDPTASSLTLPSQAIDKLANLQLQDRVLSHVKYLWSTGKPSIYALKREPKHIRNILRDWNKLHETDRVLCEFGKGQQRVTQSLTGCE